MLVYMSAWHRETQKLWVWLQNTCLNVGLFTILCYTFCFQCTVDHSQLDPSGHQKFHSNTKKWSVVYAANLDVKIFLKNLEQGSMGSIYKPAFTLLWQSSTWTDVTVSSVHTSYLAALLSTFLENCNLAIVLLWPTRTQVFGEFSSSWK